MDVANEALEAVVDARLNWWGCATLSCVRQRVLDFTEGGEQAFVFDSEDPLRRVGVGPGPDPGPGARIWVLGRSDEIFRGNCPPPGGS